MSKEKLGLELELIEGSFGRQLEIEDILKAGGTLFEHLLKQLPECSQRDEYARRSVANAFSRKQCCFQGIDAAMFLPETERLTSLEKIYQKSIAENRWDWAEKAAVAFPQCERRAELLECIVERHLDQNCANFANATAAEIPRLLTKEELEAVVSRTLEDNFSSAEIAVGLLNRIFTLEELRKGIAGAKLKGHWEVVLKIADLLPGACKDEREALVEEARLAFVAKGDSSGLQKVCEMQGRRKLTTEELKALFEKGCCDSCLGLSTVSYYAKELVKDAANISYLEEKAKELANERTSHALEIALALPETSSEKLAIVETSAKSVYAQRNDSFAKKCAESLPEGNDVRTSLARRLILVVKTDVGDFAAIKEGKKVEEVLSVVKLLPKGREKFDHLMRLYSAARAIEDELDRDDMITSGYYAVQAELNRCA